MCYLLSTVGCRQRVQPAAAGRSAERETGIGSNLAQLRGQAGRHRGLHDAEGARSGDRQRRPDWTAHRAQLTQVDDRERGRAVRAADVYALRRSGPAKLLYDEPLGYIHT